LIPFALPCLDDAEVRAAEEVIRSNWLMQGPKVAEFERLVAAYCGTRYAVAVSSCTTALHLALTVLGVGPGDEVVCPSLSFIATANAVRHAGATPVFADVDEATCNLDPDAVEAVLSPRTRAVLVVHQVGLPADLDRFLALGARHGVKIVEDAACALGSRYKGRPVGGGGSEMACFSFHPRKIITTGEGGIITTDSATHAAKLQLLRQHGMNLPVAARHGSTKVLIEDYRLLGYNYRMTDVQAAVGVAQMAKLDRIVERRRRLGRRYDEALARHPWLRPAPTPAYAEPTYQSYVARLGDDAPLSRNDLMQWLLDRGVHTRRGIMLAHREPPYRDAPLRQPLPHSERASDRSLLLPIFPGLADEQQAEVLRLLAEAGLLPAGRRQSA
jgi:dTDP-4-amino-4,6-dideoxygalactose transaminase